MARDWSRTEDWVLWCLLGLGAQSEPGAWDCQSPVQDSLWLGNTPTTFSRPKDGNDDAVFNELYVKEGYG